MSESIGCARERVLTFTERAAVDAVERCRTATLGGHVTVCLECAWLMDPSYNSSPHGTARMSGRGAGQVDRGRLDRVLPTHYFHVVFTLRPKLRGLAGANPRVVYALLFQCAAATLLELVRTTRLVPELGITRCCNT